MREAPTGCAALDRYPIIRPTISIVEAPTREIQLFEPPEDAIYTIDATAKLVSISRRTILVYCKHRLLSPVVSATAKGYSFDRNGIRALRRIEALREICGDDLAGIKIILTLTSELELLNSKVRALSQESSSRRTGKAARKTRSKTNRRRK